MSPVRLLPLFPVHTSPRRGGDTEGVVPSGTVSILGVANRWPQKLAQPFRPVGTQKRRPTVHRAGNLDGVNASLRHFFESIFAAEFEACCVGRPAARVQRSD